MTTQEQQTATTRETVEQWRARGGSITTAAKPVEAVFSSTKPALKRRPPTKSGIAATAAANRLWQLRQDKVSQKEYQRELDAFVAAQKGICAQLVRSFTGDDVDTDDLKQAAMLGVLAAIQRWVPGRGASWASWARYAVRDALRDALRQTHVVRGRTSHGRPIERLHMLSLEVDGSVSARSLRSEGRDEVTKGRGCKS